MLPMLVVSLLVPVQGWGASAGPQGDAKGVSLIPAAKASVELPSRASAGWWTSVREEIRKSEYHVTWQEHTNVAKIKAAYHAPNRAHNLRTYFTPEGIRVTPRTSTTGPEWAWGLGLRGYGFEGDVQPADQEELSVSGNRVEYPRQGLTEWYVNDERGLEQGFTLERPPKSEESHPGSWIVLKMDLYGDLKSTLNSSASAIEFATTGGVCVLRYSQLSAFDAAGRRLPAKFALAGAIIGILVDTGHAVYPITIDPLATSPNWTAESNQVDAFFGYSVGTAGDVNGDGYSDVIVGASYYDNGEPDEGRAFVYHGSASGLSIGADWTVESNQSGAVFGCSVGTAGDVNGDGYSDVIVGAYYYDNGELDEGRAFVYHGSALGLSTTADWMAESDQAGAWFGYSAGTAGDVDGDGYSDVIVGAHNYDNGESYEGRAFVYHGSASGLSIGADWTAESNQSGAVFGCSVGTAGDVDGDGYSDVIVGAHYYDNGEPDEGRAFVYYGSASGLSTTADWTGEGDQVEAYFGFSVGTAGDVNGDGYSDVIVGASYYDNGEPDEGRAFVYYGSASGLSTTADWTAESNMPSAYFGRSVGTAGDVNGDGYSDIVVGADYYTNGEVYEGRAFVYHGSASGLSTTADWTAEGDQGGAHFGRSVGTAGDVNGDGHSDVIVGASDYDNGEPDEGREPNEGRAFLYHGSALGLGTAADWTAEDDQVDAHFGCSVGTAGDVNGDGYSDVIVGAYGYDNGELDKGRAFVYHGSASGLSTAADWTAVGDQAAAVLGSSVGTAGDVNGDGYSDVIVGAYKYDNGENDEGRAFVYHGSALGLSTAADWTAEDDQAYANFGCSVGTAGDVNGDGYSDIVVGADYYTNGEVYEGRAFVYHGSASGLSTTADWTAEGDQAEAYFGWSVGTAGDVNGDGYSDVIVGSAGYSNGATDEGKAFVFFGSGGVGLSLNPRQRRYDDGAPIDHLGKSDTWHEFRLAALGRTPYGRGKVKLVWEVKPFGTVFDGQDTQQSITWMDTGAVGAEISQTVSGLSANTLYHWRVRLRYNLVTTPFQQCSRWLTMPWNGWDEADLRTGPGTNISEVVPTHGGYGIKIKAEGVSFGAQRLVMIDEQNGYYSFITFSGEPGTMIATKYPLWSDTKAKTNFKKLFIDQDGDYLQDGDEPLLTLDQLPHGDYTLVVNTIWFRDLNSNGAYNEGDEIGDIASSNSQTFTLTGEPVIYLLKPKSTPPSQPGNPQYVKIIGLNFGESQGTSTLHIDGKTWSEGHSKIELWSDNKIKFKVPNYGPPLPKRKKVWVTDGGSDSNKMRLKITAP